jgi:uncharacterized protein YdhG (YjbR/CyaY superfamily)
MKSEEFKSFRNDCFKEYLKVNWDLFLKDSAFKKIVFNYVKEYMRNLTKFRKDYILE